MLQSVHIHVYSITYVLQRQMMLQVNAIIIHRIQTGTYNL